MTSDWFGEVAPAASPNFADVGADSPFISQIGWMVAQGITTGWTMSDGTVEFRPGDPITREAMAAFLYRAAGSPAYSAPVASTFSDVTNASSFRREVEWLATQGITSGWTVDGVREFRPGNSITREAMASFLYIFAGSPAFAAPSSPSFVDVPTSSPFFKQVEWMAANGITSGWADGTFKSSNPITREATAAFLNRASLLGGGLWDGSGSTPSDVDPITFDDILDLVDAGEIEAVWSEGGGSILWIDGPFTTAEVHSEGDAANVLNSARALFGAGFSSNASDFTVQSNSMEQTFYRYSPVSSGLPVLGSQVVLVAGDDGRILGFNSTYDDRINDVNITPSVSREYAINLIVDRFLESNEATIAIDNLLLERPDSTRDQIKQELRDEVNIESHLTINAIDVEMEPYLVWLVRISSSADNIDAQIFANGLNAGLLSGVHSRREGSQSNAESDNMPSLLGIGEKSIAGSPLSDFRIQTNYCDRKQLCVTKIPSIWTAHPTFNDFTIWASESARTVLDYYRNELGYDSYDGKGSILDIYYKIGEQRKPINAWASPEAPWSITFTELFPEAAKLGVFAHEFTHMVTDNITLASNGTQLEYGSAHSGALHEAYSDIMSSLITGSWTNTDIVVMDCVARLELKDEIVGCPILEVSEYQQKVPCIPGRSPADSFSMRDFMATTYNNPTPCGKDPSTYDGVEHYQHENSRIFSHALYRIIELSNIPDISPNNWARLVFNSLRWLPSNASLLNGRFAVTSAMHSTRDFAQNPRQKEVRTAIDNAFDFVCINDGYICQPPTCVAGQTTFDKYYGAGAFLVVCQQPPTCSAGETTYDNYHGAGTYLAQCVSTPPVSTSLALQVDSAKAANRTISFLTAAETFGIDGADTILVDWGDNSGTEESFRGTDVVKHTYGKSGTFSVRIYGDITKFTNYGGEDRIAQLDGLIAVEKWPSSGLISLKTAFYGATNLTSVAQPPSSVTSMMATFAYASSYNQSIGHWNTSNVTNMAGMFDSASSFNQNIGSWDVRNVEEMWQMFKDSPFNQDISSWQPRKVWDYYGMFNGASAFNQDISGWDTSAAEDMYGLFLKATKFNQPIGSWDVSNVTNMDFMFDGAASFKNNISTWCVSQIRQKPTAFDRNSGFQNQSALQPTWGASCSGGSSTQQPKVVITPDQGNSKIVTASVEGLKPDWSNWESLGLPARPLGIEYQWTKMINGSFVPIVGETSPTLTLTPSLSGMQLNIIVILKFLSFPDFVLNLLEDWFVPVDPNVKPVCSLADMQWCESMVILGWGTGHCECDFCATNYGTDRVREAYGCE